MQQADLIALITEWRGRLQGGQRVEDPKVEFKRGWPKLAGSDANERTVSEFLKDLVAIANTPGPAGYLVYGVDESTGALHEAAFAQCGLRDQTELRGLVVKHVTRPVSFEIFETACDCGSGNLNVSVVEVRPSLDKPHVIGRYISKNGNSIENYVPIRKATGIFAANKYDFEFMFYDRKNIEPEYALQIVTLDRGVLVNSLGSTDAKTKDVYIALDIQIALENYGRKPVALTESQFVLEPHGQLGMIRPCSFELEGYTDRSVGNSRLSIQSNWIVVPSNQIQTIRAHYVGWGPVALVLNFNELGKHFKFPFSIVAKDALGNVYRNEGQSGSNQMNRQFEATPEDLY